MNHVIHLWDCHPDSIFEWLQRERRCEVPTRVSLGVSDSFNSRELHTVVCSPYEEFQSLLFVKFQMKLQEIT